MDIRTSWRSPQISGEVPAQASEPAVEFVKTEFRQETIILVTHFETVPNFEARTENPVLHKGFDKRWKLGQRWKPDVLVRMREIFKLKFLNIFMPTRQLYNDPLMEISFSEQSLFQKNLK